MAAGDTLLLWSGANSRSQHTSRGGPPSTAPAPVYDRFTVAQDPEDVTVAQGTYPIPGLRNYYFDYGVAEPWLFGDTNSHLGLIVYVNSVDAVNHWVRVTFQIRERNTTTYRSVNHYYHIGEARWEEYTVCRTQNSWSGHIEVEIKASELVVGTTYEVLFPLTTSIPTGLPLHTGRFVSPQALSPRGTMYATWIFRRGIRPVYMSNLAVIEPDGYSSTAFSISVVIDPALSTLTVNANNVGSPVTITRNTGTIYVPYYREATNSLVVLEINTDWLGSLVSGSTSSTAGAYINDTKSMYCEDREVGFLLPDSYKGAFDGSQPVRGCYLHNVSGSAQEISMYRSVVNINGNYWMDVRRDELMDGAWWLVSSDGLSPSLPSELADDGGTDISTTLLSLGTLDPGYYGGIWVRVHSDAVTPQNVPVDLIVVSS